MDTATLIDGLAAVPLLVFGSLPPDGRDLDVAARRGDEARALVAQLREHGWVQKGGQLARFADLTATSVEVDAVDGWPVSASEADALFAEARRVPGCERLLRPAPHHTLLLLARQAAYGSATDGSRRSRLEAAIDEDPAAWDEAARRAPEWGATEALMLLRSSPSPSSRRARIRSVAEIQQRRGASRGRALLRAVRASTPRRRRRGAIVALSGLDGSGKSSQAEALRDALAALGVDAAVEWTKIARNPSISLVGDMVKRVVRPVSRAGTAEPIALSGSGAAVDDPARALRQRSTLLTFGWTTFVSLANVSAHRRVTRRHVLAGRVVVCDRYVLDSATHLRYRYGDWRRYPLQTTLLRLLSPSPTRAYFLDVPAETSLERKQEQYSLEHLQRLARLYRETAPRLGVVVLDGELPIEELAALIARETWLTI